MPTSICSKCFKTRYWRNTRGSSIAGQICECGGKIVAATFDESTGKYAPRQSKNTGGKFEHCALCGRRRRISGGGKRVETDGLWKVTIGDYRTGWRNYHVHVKAGDIVCWSHTQDYPTSVAQNSLTPDRLIPCDSQHLEKPYA